MARGTKIAAWEDIVLRLIAVYKFVHGLFFIAVGVGLIQLKHKNIPQVLNDYVIQPLQLSPENKMVDWALDEASKLTPHKLVVASDVVFIYALLFCTEGIGLFLRKQWAEYFVVIVTGSLLPVEIWTMIEKVEVWKVGLIVGNLLIVGYLVHRLRLDFRRRRDDSKKNDGPAAPSRGQSPLPHSVGNGRH
jgi:uncharacterized membrane protein (DUF2068 family)